MLNGERLVFAGRVVGHPYPVCGHARSIAISAIVCLTRCIIENGGVSILSGMPWHVFVMITISTRAPLKT